MNFSDPNQKPKNYFLSQPHQPFFLLGIVWAVVVVLVFALGYKGVLPLQAAPGEFHAFTLIFIVFTHFFVGFIYTTFPRFCQSESISASSYTRVFYVYQAGAVLYVAGAVLSTVLMFAGQVVLFAAYAMTVATLWRIYKTGLATHATEDPFWILTGFGIGFAAAALWLLGGLFDWASTVATQVAFYGYVLFVLFAVAQRMVPFFSHVMTPKSPRFVATVFWLLAAKTVLKLLGLGWPEIAVDLALSAVLVREFMLWKMPFKHSPAILRVLHVALYWFPAGLALGALGEATALLTDGHTLFMQTHMLALGFFTTMLVGFGTRVTLGHSGQPPQADRFATNLFRAIQLVVAFRVIFSLQNLFDLNLFWLFDLSFTSWLVLFIVWAWRYGPVIASGKKL